MRRVVLGLFTTIVLLILFIILFTFVRHPYEIVLLDRFGTLIPENQQTRIMYNWYIKLPSDGVVRIDRRLHLYPGTLQQVVTATSAPISVQTFAAWRIVEPVKFYRTTGGSDQQAQRLVDQRIRALIGQKFGKHTLDELFNTDETKVHSGEIEKEIANEATNGSPDDKNTDGKSQGLKELGLEIAEVGFSRMAFPPNNTEQVYRRMVSELNKQSRAIESEAIAEAGTIRSKGNAEAAAIKEKASADAKTIMGQADSEANGLLADVQKTKAARDFYQYWKGLEFAKAMLSKNTIFVLSADSPLISSLFHEPKEYGPTTQPAGAMGAAPTPLNLKIDAAAGK